MRGWIVKGYAFGWFQFDVEWPCIGWFEGGRWPTLFSELHTNWFMVHIVQVSGCYGWIDTQSPKCWKADLQLNDKLNLYFHCRPWRYIANFYVDDVLGFIINLTIGYLSSLLQCLVILLLGLFFFLHLTNQKHIIKFGMERVQARIRILWETVLNLEETRQRILVALSQHNLG